MYDTIRTGAGLGKGINPAQIARSRENLRLGYMAGQQLPGNIIDDSDFNPIQMPFFPLKEKTKILANVHQNYNKKLLDFNGMHSYVGTPQMGTIDHKPLPPVNKIPLYGGGGGREQLDNIVDYFDSRAPAQNTIYATEKARQWAQLLLNSSGMIPKTKINEQFEAINSKLSGLTGELAKVVPGTIEKVLQLDEAKIYNEKSREEF